MPSAEDNRKIYQSVVEYVIRFVAHCFKHLHHLASACLSKVPFKPPGKTQVSPLEILDINGGSTDGNIRILEKFAHDIYKSDAAPVVSQIKGWSVIAKFDKCRTVCRPLLETC